MRPMTGAEFDVLAERHRQVSAKGENFSAERDDTYVNNELVLAAVAYTYEDGAALLESNAVPLEWPASWDKSWYKPTTRRRDLVKAAALLLAEIERLDRIAAKSSITHFNAL